MLDEVFARLSLAAATLTTDDAALGALGPHEGAVGPLRHPVHVGRHATPWGALVVLGRDLSQSNMASSYIQWGFSCRQVMYVQMLYTSDVCTDVVHK